MPIRHLAHAALCVLLATTASAATSPVLDDLRGGDKLRALVDSVVERQRSVEGLRADFVQLKSSDMLLEPVRSSGEFRYLAPDRVRWDYDAPEEMVVLYADNAVTTYHPEERLAERVKISRRHQRFVQALAGTQPLDELAAQFRMTLFDPGAPAAYRLQLQPTHRTLASRLEEVVLEIDRELLLPVAVEYREADGDRTRFEFNELEVDPALDPGGFELELGPDVEVETIDAGN